MNDFLPVSKEDMEKRGWDAVDFVYISGDAYVDHPSFGHAIITRVLESRGYRVGIIAQPDWKTRESIAVFGRPRLGFLVSSGNMDSMVNHYTAAKKRRSSDAYSSDGQMGRRPDRAVTVYCNLIRSVYKDAFILIGGIEASLRRFSHYDYWSDSVKRGILLDSQADMLLYGMGERSIAEAAAALSRGDEAALRAVKGSCYFTKTPPEGARLLPCYEDVCTDRKKYAKSFMRQYENTDPFTAEVLAEPYNGVGYIVQNPPQPPLTQEEMDAVYALPYMRKAHPSNPNVPATQEVEFSLTSCRGCFGGCSFCALTFHQGRIIQTRSHDSLIAEARLMIKSKNFKGYIHDVGGPTANFRRPACDKQFTGGACRDRQCLSPRCPNLKPDHSDYLALLKKLRALDGVKRVFIRSGIRFDYLCYDKSDEFLYELSKYHISGQLKVAPEHVSDRVLEAMGKPPFEVYRRFTEKFARVNRSLGLDQYLVPYLMSSHPGSTLSDAVKLAEYLRDIKHQPEQVQDFYPTPATLSTAMYYTGLDPRTMKPIYVARTAHEKDMQRALLQFRNPKNYPLVYEALVKASRRDLIGSSPKCLIHPRTAAQKTPIRKGKSKK